MESTEALLDQAYSLRVNNLTKSIAIVSDVLQSVGESNPAVRARALNLLGLFQMIKGDRALAIRYSNEALSISESIQNKKGIADARYNIGSVYYKSNNYHEGLENLLICLKYYRELGEHSNEARVLKSIGTIYEYFGDTESAIDSYIRCIQAAEQVDDLNQISNAFNPLSGIYLDRGEVQKAVELIDEAIRIKETTHDRRGLAYSIYGRGKCFYKKGDYLNALNDFKQALELHEEMGDKLGQGMVYNKLGQTHAALANQTLAHASFQKAMAIATELNISFLLFKAHYHLYQLELKNGNTGEALKHLEDYIRTKDAVINNDTISIIKSYQNIKRIESLEHEAKIQKEKADITTRKNAELDAFFYRISHDLKGPIASLLGLYNMVEMEVKDETSKNYFTLYHSQIQHLHGIVTDLINLTRMNHSPESGTLINFPLLIDECIRSLSFLENASGITFRTDIQPDLNFISERSIINTIIQNLLENGIKYSRRISDPFVSIRVWRAGDFVCLEVEDNGAGIAEQYQQKVFDAFFRANDHVQGTGLGLYILKRAVERLEGTVALRSLPNQGTTFTITLPYQGR